MRKWLTLIFLLMPASASAQTEALAEVNAARAARGLRPYVYDANLTAGAMNLAKWRADRLIVGHTSNDFSGLPVGVSASAAGCAAWHPSLGWGSCATFDNYTFAGAASCVGRDGLIYHHLFVAGPTQSSQVNYTISAANYTKSRRR